MDDRVLTLVVGWDTDNPLHDEIIDAAHSLGWDTQAVVRIDQDDMAENELSSYFSDYVLWRRSMFDATDYENNRVQYWINNQCYAPMNTHIIGSSLISSDKYFQHGVFSMDRRLSDYVLPMYAVGSCGEVKELLRQGKMEFPFLIKDRIGSIGKGITLVRNMEELDNYGGGWHVMAIEPYVEAECDWRVFVIGGVAIGMMRKYGDPDHPENFEAKSGGRRRANETRPLVRAKLAKIAEDVAAVMHLEYAGVDIIQDKNTGKYYVLEVNLAAGWRNRFVETTGASVAMALAKWFQSRRDLKYLPVEDAVRKYLKDHEKRMMPMTYAEYNRVLAGHALDERSNKKISDVRGMTLVEKLRWLYSQLILHRDELSEEDLKKFRYIGKMIVDGAERQVSWAGNFVGADTLEDGAVSSAYYLAVKEALS